MEDDDSGYSNRSATGNKGRKGSQNSGGGDPYSILSVLRGALSSGSGKQGSDVRPVSYHRGGKVGRTGLAKVKRGEYVIPVKKVKRIKQALRGSKRKPTGRR